MSHLIARATLPGGGASQARRRANHNPRRRNRRIGLAFVAVPLVFYAVVVLVPLAQSFQYSFYNWDGVSRATWVGLGNYIQFFTDPVLQSTLSHVLVLIFFFSQRHFLEGIKMTGLKG